MHRIIVICRMSNYLKQKCSLEETLYEVCYANSATVEVADDIRRHDVLEPLDNDHGKCRSNVSRSKAIVS